MQNIRIILENQYKLKTNNIYKYKSYYICNTNQGVYKFRETYSTLKEIYFKNEIKNHLEENGFKNFDKVVLTKDKNFFVKLGRKNYLLTLYKDYKKFDFGNNDEFELVIYNIGLLHSFLRNIKFKEFVNIGIKNPMKNIDRDIELFNLINKKLTRQSIYSDFDIYFLKNLDKNIKTMVKCKKEFEKQKINSIIDESINKNIVCHGMLKENCILINNKDVMFENFSHSSVKPQIYDFSFFIKRYIRKVPNNHLRIDDILKTYKEANKYIGSNELELLRPLLAYPEEYISLCNEYYEKKRSWIPKKFTNKLEELRNNSKIYENYLDE